MRVAFIAAECEPWAKTGGLADVVDALARALGQAGAAELDGLVDVFLPRYRSVAVPDGRRRRDASSVPGPARPARRCRSHVLAVETHGYRLHLVDHPPAFDRDGLYGDANGDYPDNAWRFGLLCRAALERLRAGRAAAGRHPHPRLARRAGASCCATALLARRPGDRARGRSS